tara:strand:+ start:29 stop:232 length:204 start_codon:yes stop_codon:yes gene_type:complete
MSKTIYINKKDCYGNLETVDEFTEGQKYARQMLAEYRLSDCYAYYYMSQRCCKDWLEHTDNEEISDE